MTSIAIIAAAAWILAGQAAAGEKERVDVAILFLVDASDSMTAPELTIARWSHALAMTSSEVLHAVAEGEEGRVAVAYMEYADRPDTQIGWTLIDGAASARAFAGAVTDGKPPVPGAMTGLGIALLAADALLGAMPYDASRLVVDIVGDGASNVGPSPWLGRTALLSRGAVINAMPLMREPACVCVDSYFTSEITGGPGHFTMPIIGVGTMPTALRSKIVLEMY